MIGRRLGTYQLIERVGEGGMGAVYRAEDVMLGREAAIKVLRPELAHDRSLIDRFRQEARNLAQVVHQNVAGLYGLFQEDDVLFMAMEFARGETVDAMLARRGALPWSEAVALIAGVLAGLDAAHRRGIIHRDLKPANLIAGPAGVKITDFGIARMLGAARQTRTGAIVGTLAYMAPEQIKGEEGDLRTDIYATGMVLYELLTGAVAFRRTSEYDLMRAVVEEPARPPRDTSAAVPAWLDRIVTLALEKDPASRFQSAGEMLQAIEAGVAAIPASDRRVLATRIAEIAPSPATRIAIAPAPETVVAAAPSTRLARIGSQWTWKHSAAAAAVVLVTATLGIAAMRGGDGETAPKTATTPPPSSASSAPPASLALEPAPQPIAAPIMPPPDAAPLRRPVVVREPEPAPVRPAPVDHAPEPPPVAAPPAPETPASSARKPALEAVTFDKIKMLQSVGGKVRELDARLTFDGDRILVSSEKTTAMLKTISYRALTGATFSQSKHPRWKEGGAAAVAIGVFATPLFFMKGTKHWLTLETGADFVVLRLDKNNFRMVLPALEARWGKSIDRQVEDK